MSNEPTIEDTRRRLVEELQRMSARQRDLKDWQMRGKMCPIQRPMKDRWP